MRVTNNIKRNLYNIEQNSSILKNQVIKKPKPVDEKVYAKPKSFTHRKSIKALNDLDENLMILGKLET